MDDEAGESMRDNGLVLALDASTPRCVIALGRISVARGEASMLGGEIVSDAANQASGRLIPAIEALLAGANVSASDLDAVACGRGPGTFTGTRVAVATAMGLALGAGCPAIEVSTLAAVAASLERGGPTLALLDARRDEVYGACFEVFHGESTGESTEGHAGGTVLPRVRPVGGERCLGLAALLADISHDVWPVGPGVEPYLDAMPAEMRARATATSGPTPRGLWHATLDAVVSRRLVQPAALRAVYLRQSYAEMGVNVPKNPFKKNPFV
ncbi:MAG: tRNA (adenosine(37)-N6)-threonylcarbamoyltransferase complex dimerization subunit type 1 TsaB [Nannocystaceae bacterium]|nr:tRNA (adenosine(37)-N6)-threonylcarbamoyltransferase complex dimerization subunit type 1 TsaB [Nannocystaceae bacterium]